MGRPTFVADEPTCQHCLVLPVQADEDDHAYDAGGAYWGAPANIWVCLNDDMEPIAFVRAWDYDEACREVKTQLRGKMIKIVTNAFAEGS